MIKKYIEIQTENEESGVAFIHCRYYSVLDKIRVKKDGVGVDVYLCAKVSNGSIVEISPSDISRVFDTKQKDRRAKKR